MRTQWIIIGGIAAAATTAGIVYAIRKRRHAAVAEDIEDPFDVVEAEIIEVESIPIVGISLDPDAPVPGRY